MNDAIHEAIHRNIQDARRLWAPLRQLATPGEPNPDHRIVGRVLGLLESMARGGLTVRIESRGGRTSVVIEGAAGDSTSSSQGSLAACIADLHRQRQNNL